MPEDKNYIISLPDGRTEAWSEDTYNQNKDKLFGKYPEAQVTTAGNYDPEAEVSGNSNYIVSLPDGRAEAWNGETFANNREKLFAKYPDAQVKPISVVDYWGDRLRETEDALNKAETEIATITSIDPKAGMRPSSGMFPMIPQDNSTAEERTRYRELSKQIETLRADRENNYAYKQQLAAKAKFFDEEEGRLEQMRKDMAKANPKAELHRQSYWESMADDGAPLFRSNTAKDKNPEYERDYQALQCAENYLNDARQTALAPSKNDSSNGFANFFKGAIGSVPDAITVKSLMDAGLETRLISTIEKIQKNEGKAANLFELMNEPEKTAYLSTAEKEMVKAFLAKTAIDAQRAGDLSLAYQAGQSAMLSLGFMADFMLFGGTGSLAEKTATAVTKPLINAVAKASAQAGLKGTARKAALAIPKFAIGTVGAAAKTLAMTPMMPSSWASFTDGLLSVNDAGQVDLSGKEIIRNIGDVLIENLSENAGGTIEPVMDFLPKLAGKGLDKALASTKFADWAKIFRNSGAERIMREGAWHGYFGEMGEEWYGNALRVLTGVDKDALKNFATADQQLITALSFAPMSIFGVGTSAAQYGLAKKRLSKAGETLSQTLERCGYDAEQIQDILDVTKAENPTELAAKLSPIISQIASDNRDGADGTQAVKAIEDYAMAVAQWRTFDGIHEADVQDQRNKMLNELTDAANATTIVQAHTDKDTGATWDTVRIITDAEGKKNYVIGKDENGYIAAVTEDGRRIFLPGEEEIAQSVQDGIMSDTGEMRLDDYLDREIARRKGESETARMDADRQQQAAQIVGGIETGQTINLGTEENPIAGVVIEKAPDGVIIQSPDGTTEVFTPDELAQRMGTPIEVRTDDELEAAQTEAAEAAAEAMSYFILRRTNPQADRTAIEIPDGNGGTYKVVDGHLSEQTGEIQCVLEDGSTVSLPAKGVAQAVKDHSERQAAAQTSEGQAPAAPAADAEQEGATATTETQEDETPKDFRGKPLPMTAEGEVDETALWNDSPEAWAKWNDQTRGDNGKNSVQYISAAAQKTEKDIKALQKKNEKELDFGRRRNNENEIAQKSARLAELNGLLAGYRTEAEGKSSAALAEAKAKAEEARKAKAEELAKYNTESLEGIKTKWDNAQKIEGMEDSIILPSGEEIKGKYVLTEAYAPTASHDTENGYAQTKGFPVDENGNTVNDRDYEHDKEAQRQVEAKAASYDQRALQTPVVVSRDGVVLSGNDRTMASQLAARGNSDSKYTDYLRGHAAKYGFTEEQIGQFANPRVLFVPDEDMPYNAATFSKFNAEDKKTQSKTESAVKAGKVVPAETLARIAGIIDGHESIAEVYADENAVAAILRELVAAGVVQQNEISRMKDGDLLSGTGEDLVESVLLGAALREDALRCAMEDRAMRRSIMSALAQLIQNSTFGDYSLTEEFSDAVVLLYQAKKSGLVKGGESVANFMNQPVLEGFGENPTAKATVQLIANVINGAKVNGLKNLLSLYNPKAAMAVSGQADLFLGDVETKEQIIREILEQYGYNTETYTGGQQSAAGEQDSAGAGEQEEGGNSDEQTPDAVSGTLADGAAGEEVAPQSEEAAQEVAPAAETETETPAAETPAEEAPKERTEEKPSAPVSLVDEAKRIAEEQKAQKEAQKKAEEDYEAQVRSIEVRDAKFPTLPNPNVTDFDMRRQKGGKKANAASVKLAFMGNDLYISLSGGGQNLSVVIPNGRRLGSVDICYRLEMGIGADEDAVRLAKDCILDFYRKNKLRQHAPIITAQQQEQKREQTPQQGDLFGSSEAEEATQTNAAEKSLTEQIEEQKERIAKLEASLDKPHAAKAAIEGRIAEEKRKLAELEASLNDDSKESIPDPNKSYERMEKIMGLIPASEIKSAEDIASNIRKIVEFLFAHKAELDDAENELSVYGGWTYTGHAFNAARQVQNYLRSLSGIDSAILDEWKTKYQMNRPDSLGKYVLKLYKEQEKAADRATTDQQDNPAQNSSSEGKGANNSESSNAQGDNSAKVETKKGSEKEDKQEGKQKIEDFGEQIAGARKDILRDMAKKLSNATIQSLVELPFSKVFKRPDLRKMIETGALREKDAQFADAVICAFLSSRKPVANTHRNRRIARYGGETDVQKWAKFTYQGIEILKMLFDADESTRDALIEKTLSFKYYGVESAKEEQERLEEMNPGRTFNGTCYPINPVLLFHDVIEKLGYPAGEKFEMPAVTAQPDSRYAGYRIGDKGDHYLGDATSYDAAVDWIVYLAKVANADEDTEHNKESFRVLFKNPIRQVTGYRVFGATTEARYRRDKYDINETYPTKEEAQKAVDECKAKGGYAVMSEKRDVVGFEKYVIAYANPLTGEKLELGKEYGTEEEAEAVIAAEREELNRLTNEKLAEEAEKAGTKRESSLFQIVYYWDAIQNGEKAEKPKFVYGVQLDEKYTSTKPGSMPVMLAGGFATRAEAQKHLDEHKEEWTKQVQDLVESRRNFAFFGDENESRVGEDYRNGRDISEQEFKDAFGFRGGQFGNWANQRDRQAALNNAYDAFMDLAKVLGISPKAISLNGELGIAFGSRGSGSANAHYEPEEVVINLTKTRGAGSLAHEWWHALDNYFARSAGAGWGFVTDKKTIEMREEMRSAFNRLIDDVEKSDYHTRSKDRGSNYWGSKIEETARLFAEWVASEMAKRGETNPFLVRRIKTAEEYAKKNYDFYRWGMATRNEGKQWDEMETPMSFEEFRNTPMALKDYVYPTAEEIETLGADVRSIFDTTEERRNEETGNVALFQVLSKELGIASPEQQLAYESVSQLLSDAGVPVEEVSEETLEQLSESANAELQSKKSPKTNWIDNYVNAVNFIGGGEKKAIRAELLNRIADAKRQAKELYAKVLSGDFNSVTLRQINDYIDNATNRNRFYRPLSQRLPERALLSLSEGGRAGEVDALFSRICESAVPANGRTGAEARRRIEAKKEELLEGWAKATGNWHESVADFTENTEPIGHGTDSEVYMSNDGATVIKASKGKFDNRKFPTDIDQIPLFNIVFPRSAYRILGYGRVNGQFVKYLEQPYIDFGAAAPLSVEERVRYMHNLGFAPQNEEKTIFSNGQIIVSDLQKANIVKDAAGNIRVIDADVKLHTKDIGGNYSYPPVETDTEIFSNNTAQFMTVYHGSGKKFDRFDSAYIGTGEGSQAYGWGHYVTEVEGIGQHYTRNGHSTYKGEFVWFINPTTAKDARNNAAYYIIEKMEQGASFKEAVEQVRADLTEYIESTEKFLEENQWLEEHEKEDRRKAIKMYRSSLEALSSFKEEDFSVRTAPILYTVDVPDDNGSNYLNWSETLPKAQRKQIADYLRTLNNDELTRDAHKEGWSGLANTIEREQDTAQGVVERLREAVGSKRRASEILSNAGFVGIKTPTRWRTRGNQDGTFNYVIFKDSDLVIKSSVQFLRDGDVVYGAAVGGKILLNKERLNPDTPIHEYTHLWDKACKATNPELWKKGVELMKQTSLWKEVENDPNYAGLDEEGIASEVHARLTGEHGAELLERLSKEALREKGAINAAAKTSVIAKLRKWLTDFWYWVKDTMTPWQAREVQRVSLEDFVNMPIADLAKGTQVAQIVSEINAGQKAANGKYLSADEFNVPQFSISKNNRKTIDSWLDKWERNYSERYGEDAARMRPAIAQWIDDLDNPTLQLAWTKWFCTGKINLGQADMPKVEQAVKLAKKVKVDPLSFASPMDIIEQFRDAIKEKPIDPDTVPTLHKASELPYGLTVYDVDEGKESMQNMRQIINTHFGEDASPWCLLRGDGKGNLHEDAEYYWGIYSAYPKRVVFRDGKLLAFCANDTKERLWWDRMDESYKGIPISVKLPDDELGRSAIVEIDETTGEKGEKYHNVHKGNRQNGEYESWVDDSHIIEHHENGLPVGETRHYRDGVLRFAQVFNDEGLLMAKAISYNNEGEIDELECVDVDSRDRNRYTTYRDGSGQITEQYETPEAEYRKSIGNIYYGEERTPIIRGHYSRKKHEGPYRESDESVSWSKESNTISSCSFRFALDTKGIARIETTEGRRPGYIIFPAPGSSFKRGEGELPQEYLALIFEKYGIEGEPTLGNLVKHYEAKIDEVMPNGHAMAESYFGNMPKTENTEDNAVRYRIMGENGAASLDKADNTNGRLDALALARRMKVEGKSVRKIRQATGWELGRDGKWRYETVDDYAVSDEAVEKLRNAGDSVRLDEIVNDRQLFAAYPQLRECKVRAVEMSEGTNGTSWGGSIDVNSRLLRDGKRNRAALEKALTHEIQHEIQRIEGFEMNDSEDYSFRPHEVEARNAANRMKMGESARRRTPLYETEDVVGNTRYEGGAAANGVKVSEPHYEELSEDAREEVFNGAAHSIVTDKAEIERLNGEPTIKVYRAMQLRDGKLYPPMAGKVNGEWQQGIAVDDLGTVWEKSDEHPELADEKGRFTLNKGNGTSLKARYNPYIHTSTTPLNDQFSSAQSRPELVTVEVEVPQSELSSGYRAEKAKDSVGKVEWKAGVVQGQLTGTREVILSRWDKPMRIVPDSEVADRIMEMFDGKEITMPSNVVTPSLRAELEKKGVPFVETDNTGKPVVSTENESTEEVNKRFNEELQRQIDGTLPNGHIYQIGMPGTILRSTGFPNMPIELSATKLAEKAAQRNHEFGIGDIKNLVKAINNPLGVFSYGDKNKAQNVIVDLERDGKHFVVGVHFNQKHRGIEVSDIRGLFNKDNAEWLNWISQGKAIYLNKAEIQTLIDKQRTNLAEVEYLDLDSVTKVVNDFENPSESTENQSTDERFKDIFYNSALNNQQAVLDAIDAQLEWSSSVYDLQEALEAYYGGEIVAASSNAEYAMKSDGLVPFPGGQFEGQDHEYHHIAFKDANGEIHIEAVPFRPASEVEAELRQKEGLEREGERSYNAAPTSLAHSMSGKRYAAEEMSGTVGVPVEIISRSELPAGHENAKGMWKGGKIYVCLENHPDADDVRKTVLHEAVGHNGLRRIVGDRNMDKFCMDVFAALPKSEREKITDAALRKYKGDFSEATEEYLAELAETMDLDKSYDTIWDKIRVAVRNLLAKVGINVPLSQRDLKWLLYQSYNANNRSSLINEAHRQVVANRLGFSLAAQNMRAKAQEQIRMRDNALAAVTSAATRYNLIASRASTRLHETWVDMHNSVDELVKAVEKQTGKVAKAFEDIRLALNQQSSKSLAEIEAWERDCYNPMIMAIRDIVKAIGGKREDVDRYALLKHGLERNKVFAARDAREHYQSQFNTKRQQVLADARLTKGEKDAKIDELQAKLDAHLQDIENETDAVYLRNREKDYGGLTALFSDFAPITPRGAGESNESYNARVLAARTPKYDNMADTEDAARQEVADFEAKAGSTLINNLWKAVNKATKTTLKHQYDANMLSKEQYDSVKDMFEFYVPMRGFKENTAEDMYSYYGKSEPGPLAPPIIHARGRKTEAESPWGYIGAMASTAYALDEKNRAKLALYYFTQNRPENDLIFVSDVWYERAGIDPTTGKVKYKPVFPPFTDALDTPGAKAAYDAWEADMKDKQSRGEAVKGTKRIDLQNSVIFQSGEQEESHIIHLRVRGEEKMIIINGNPRAAQAINNDLNLDATAEGLTRGAQKVLRLMAAFNTSYNPAFWFSNAQRDLLFSIMATSIKGDKEYTAQFVRNLGKAIKVVTMVRRNKKGTLGTSPLEQQYREFVENGGVTGYTVLKDNEEWEEMGRKMMADRNKAGQAVMSALEAVQEIGEGIEQMTRFAAFLTARQNGKDMKDAVADAKELTVNFNRKGSGKTISWKESAKLTDKNGEGLSVPERVFYVGASMLAGYGRRAIMFFNASVQGLNTLYKLWATDKRKTAAWMMGYFALGVLNSMLHAMLDDDDDYLDMPDYERRNNALIGGNGHYIKWALPQESRVFYAMGDILVNDVILGRSPQKKTRGFGDAIEAVGDILPVNPMNGLRGVMPQVLVPLFENLQNEDYKGAKIYNDSRWLSEDEKELTPKYTQAFSDTGKPFELVSMALNSISGGDKYDAGTINIAPEKIEHIFEGYTGGLGTTLNQLWKSTGGWVINAAADAATGDTTFGQALKDDFSLRSTPFLNRMFVSNDDRYRNTHINEVYNYYKAEAEHTEAAIKRTLNNDDLDAMDKIYDDEERMNILWTYKAYEKVMDSYSDLIKDATTTAERRELVQEQDEWRKDMIDDIAELNK